MLRKNFYKSILNKRKYVLKLRIFMLIGIIVFSINAHAQEVEEFELSKSQWWVLGITGAALAGSTLATHQKEGQEGAKVVALVGLVSFVGVTIFEHNKKGKSKKASIAYVDNSPSLVFSATF